jgi:hypothetical protein
MWLVFKNLPWYIRFAIFWYGFFYRYPKRYIVFAGKWDGKRSISPSGEASDSVSE